MDYYFVTRLQNLMEMEQVFLNPRITLTSLALQVGTNRTYLSKYINEKLGQTFFDYVNSKRLAHATHLLETTNLTLEVVAERAGFNSLSTFRRCFMRQYKCSPTIYRRDYMRGGKMSSNHPIDDKK